MRGATVRLRFLGTNSEEDDYAWHAGWLEMLRRDRVQGKVWQRVRIVSLPPSDWTRYAMHVARLSNDAGDDIRYLARDIAEQGGIRPYDSWLLDDARLVRLHFRDDDDRFVRAELITDTATVDRHREWRTLAWSLAVPLDDFAGIM